MSEYSFCVKGRSSFSFSCLRYHSHPPSVRCSFIPLMTLGKPMSSLRYSPQRLRYPQYATHQKSPSLRRRLPQHLDPYLEAFQSALSLSLLHPPLVPLVLLNTPIICFL